MLSYLLDALQYNHGRWLRPGKATLSFAVFFLLTVGYSLQLHAEDESSVSSFPLSGSLRLTGEGEKSTLSHSLLNPSNILMRPETRAEGFLLGNTTFKGLGGAVESEIRLGYEFLDGKDSSFLEKKLSDVNINQLYYQATSGPFLFQVGRKKVRWGVGYSYSPTDLITQLKNPEDPEDRLNKIKGADLFQLTYIKNNSELDLVYFPMINWSSSNAFINSSRFGLRWYNLIDPFDLAFVGKAEQQGQWASGLNTSVAIGKAIELHAEYLYTSQSNTNYPNLYLDPSETAYPFFLQQKKKGANDILLGGQVTFYGDWNLTAEYLYHGSGYSSEEFNAYINRLKSLNMQFGTSYNQLPIVAGLQESALNFSTPLRQHYLFGRLYHPNVTHSISLEMYSFLSLADRSGLFVIKPKYTGSKSYEVYYCMEKFWGKNVTEFGLIPDRLKGIVGISLFLDK